MSKEIKPISKNVVHRICSGQVVLSLAIAVKELVENSIDAGATIIDITLKEYGSELIEVSDNGNGVLPENFEALTLKHYTSKIEDFSDLQTLETLGFRGEALSSLCALADLYIVTKHSLEEQAKKIKYDKNGKIEEIAPAARQTGTTVTLENLFSTLPVRRKDFLKNLKREFNKMCQLLYAYCLVSKSIKFTCTNITNKGSKNVVVSTQGSSKVRENIISIFGAKQISTLIDVEVISPNENILDEFNVKLESEGELPFNLDFLISSVTHGDGRSTTDRQFFYVNSRPVEPLKIIKLVNQVYKQYNVHQYPFVYLNIILKSSIVDINVTPDKRQIFLEKENLLLATIKSSLLESFKVFPSKLPTENQDISVFLSVSNSERKGMKRSLTDTPSLSKSLDSFRKKSKSDSNVTPSNLKNFFKDSPKIVKINFEDSINSSEYKEITMSKGEKLKHKKENEDSSYKETEELLCKIKRDQTTTKVNITTLRDESVEKLKSECNNINTDEFESNQTYSEMQGKHSEQESRCFLDEEMTSELKDEIEVPHFFCDESPEKSPEVVEIGENEITNSKDIEIILDAPSKNPLNRKTINLTTSLNSIRDSLKEITSEESTSDNIKVKFRSTIDPQNNENAEKELQKQLSKQDFFNMSIIGQFNLGFIIARLENDLFIIDQHATDEKYNFEQLQANTVLQKQVLVNPKPLELTAGNEMILIENEEIFKKNGFHFKIDKDAPSTKKILLTAVPVSKNLVFGKDEIDELLFMLKDSSHTMCRPSRLRAMFASRACRKSVMIGKSLSKKDMKQLIDHMGEIDQPWNCPHGRPTIRHLINLDLLLSEET